MDSFSQSGPNLNDEVQQSHWGEETNKLWSEATFRNETFEFKTIDDVLEENALCKEENNRLNDIIAEDIKQLKDNVTSLDNAITVVNDEVTFLSITVDTNSASISHIDDQVLTLSTRGRWCGQKFSWDFDNSIITYDSMVHHDTNMDVSVTPLDITTGMKFTNNCITPFLTFVSLQASSLCP